MPQPRRWSGCDCVAAYVGNLRLDRPISIGELVELHASIVYTGRSSMHILVTIYSSDPTGTKAFKPRNAQSFSSRSTMQGPCRIPPWTPVTMLDLQRQRQARVRIPMRKRVEGAMAAESYTAEGLDPAPRIASSPLPPTSIGAAKFTVEG